MAAPKHARGRAGLGRPPGAQNRVSRELRLLAREYTDQALAALAEVMLDSDSPAAARVAAAVALLDRGHGRPTQQREQAGTIDDQVSTAAVRERLAAQIARLATAARDEQI